MYRSYKRELVERARDLRKHMTPQERKLWFCFLRGYPTKFLRQRIIGPYIVDFYCASASVAVEVDGGGHYEAKQWLWDKRRTQYLNRVGVEVLRVTNTDVDNRFEAVCSGIDQLVRQRLCPMAEI